MQQCDEILKWFAIRVITDRQYVLSYMERAAVELSRISDIPSLLFIHCTARTIESIRDDIRNRCYFYTDPTRKTPQPIPDGTMRTFLLLAPYHGLPVFYISVEDPALFNGPTMRVTGGEFKGCEGVLKRIKGEKRLIIKVSDHGAIATPHIPAALLEDLSRPAPKPVEIRTPFHSVL